MRHLILPSGLLTATFVATTALSSAQMVLNRGNGGEPGSLDPHQISGTWEASIARDQFLSLYTEAADGSIIPGAAESHMVSDDGLVYTFTLREHTWSDGTPVTAADFEFSFKRILDPATSSGYAYLLYTIDGAEEFNAGEAEVDAVGVTALDDQTLEVRLATPAPYFIAQTTHQTAYPVPKHIVEAYGADWARPENIEVNGAFKVSDWKIGEVLTVEKNPLFYDADQVALDAVNFYPIESATTELNLYREGALDITENVPTDVIDELREEFGDELLFTPYGGTYYYAFNTNDEALSDPAIRNALSMAIDRAFIANEVDGTGVVPAYGFVPTSISGGYEVQTVPWADTPYDERVAMAAETLAAAGYTADAPLALTLSYNTNDAHKNIALAVADMWAEIGVAVELYNSDVSTHYDALQAQDFQVGRAGWIWDYPDAENLLALMKTGVQYNYGEYSNAEFDELLAASYTQSGTTRMATLQAAEALAMAEAALAPIYYYNSKHLVAPYVEGYIPNGDDRHASRWISFSE